MSIFSSKKAKKAAQLKKNRFHQEIFNALRLRRAEEDRVVDLAPKPTKKQEEKESVVWSEKTASVRNRLTDKKRVSKERWNRFSGTDAAGARGL